MFALWLCLHWQVLWQQKLTNSCKRWVWRPLLVHDLYRWTNPCSYTHTHTDMFIDIYVLEVQERLSLPMHSCPDPWLSPLPSQHCSMPRRALLTHLTHTPGPHLPPLVWEGGQESTLEHGTERWHHWQGEALQLSANYQHHLYCL